MLNDDYNDNYSYVPPTPTAIDPAGCLCTECITGQYIQPFDATREQKWKCLMGALRNNTRETPSIVIRGSDFTTAPNGGEVDVVVTFMGEDFPFTIRKDAFIPAMEQNFDH